MAELNTNIALSGTQVAPVDPLAIYLKGAQLQAYQQQAQLHELTARKEEQDYNDSRTLADLYKGAVNPDGTVDRTKIYQGAAERGLGAKIPALQKSFLDADTAGATLNKTRADTAKTHQEILHAGLKETDNTIASLLARPDVNENMVMSELGRLVRVGAFNAQAANLNTTPDEYAKQMVSTMPLGNPQALRNWLTQTGMRVMDASKRVEMALPKYDEQDRGGVINEGTINQLTGQRTSGTNQVKTLTPEGAAIDRRQGEANAIAKEAAASQVVETPQGYSVINKGAADARPVRNVDGQPVLSANSTVAKNASMARNMTGVIPYARELLKSDPTSSGVGALADKLSGQIGLPLKSKDVAGQLETLGGWMTSNVPRFEGPQGVQDVIIYQQMAGAVGDRTKSVSERLKAVDTVERLMQKYSGAPGTDPATPIAPRPVLPVRGTTAAAPRGSSPMRGGGAPAAPAAAPDINSFFR